MSLLMCKSETAHEGGVVLMTGAGVSVPVKKDAAETVAEDRLYVRRKERHAAALRGHEDVARSETLFNVDRRARDWNMTRKIPKGAEPYVKFTQPVGNLTSKTAEDLTRRLDLPTTPEMVLLTHLLYRHFYKSTSAKAFAIPKQYVAIRSALKKHFNKRQFSSELVDGIYRTFKTMMNDPATFDDSQVAARGRVQSSRPPTPMPVPLTANGKVDQRYTAGTYHSSRDMLDRSKYTSVAGGPFGQYQIDLLDMNRKGKPYNKQFWYLLTAINTNSRYVYAVPIKKGGHETKTQTAAQRRSQKELSDYRANPKWIQRQIIPAMERIRRQIEVDIDQDEHSAHPKGLTHRRMDSVMTDAGSEFQVTFKAWLAREGISSITCAPETHEEMSRLNSFHRYFRQRYQTQWQKYHQNPREYGGPVRWISPQARSDGFVAPDAEEEAVAAEAKDIELTRFEPEDQKLAVAAGAWRITYWEDWVKSHNETVKANSLRGATMREKGGENVPYHVARRPADIGDAMVHNLVRYDAARREVVKQRVDDWMKDNNVLTMADLSDSEQGYATRVRLDLNRTKFGKELKNKATTFLSIWSQRHYPLVRRVGTNTFEVQHGHETDFPDVWPMYRMRSVHACE